MSAVAKQLARFSLRTADDRIGIVPAGKRWIVTEIVLTNTAASAVTFRLHHVQSREASGTFNALVYDWGIAISATVFFLGGTSRIVLKATEELRGLASAAQVTVQVYGIEEDA